VLARLSSLSLSSQSTRHTQQTAIDQRAPMSSQSAAQVLRPPFMEEPALREWRRAAQHHGLVAALPGNAGPSGASRVSVAQSDSSPPKATPGNVAGVMHKTYADALGLHLVDDVVSEVISFIIWSDQGNAAARLLLCTCVNMPRAPSRRSGCQADLVVPSPLIAIDRADMHGMAGTGLQWWATDTLQRQRRQPRARTCSCTTLDGAVPGTSGCLSTVNAAAWRRYATLLHSC
jgi:hypothetical protein